MYRDWNGPTAGWPLTGPPRRCGISPSRPIAPTLAADSSWSRTTRREPEPLTERRKKLIEVALPLDAINAAAAREKSIRHGHPSTLHLWWARRPLAAARAVIFAQMVDDPASRPELFPTEQEQDCERQRLLGPTALNLIIGRVSD